jgi:cytoskeletal protein CcmA (bactofilin family)
MHDGVRRDALVPAALAVDNFLRRTRQIVFDGKDIEALMFTRSPTVEPKSIERRTRSNGANGAQPALSAPSTGEKSVIGNDLKIIGQGLKIIGRGTLQVDGEVEGDVQAAEVIIGEQGKVTGMVAGQQVVVRGKVSGVVCAKNVALQASSEVQGDIHHMSFAIEQGALFEGRSRRAADESALNSVIEGRSAERSYTSGAPSDA